MPARSNIKYTEKLAEKLCERIASGRSLRSISKDEDMPSCQTVFRWFRQRPEFLRKYELAQAERAEFWAEEIMEIADANPERITIVSENGSTSTRVDAAAEQHRRTRIDTRKWIASKLKPKKYGDSMTHRGDPSAPVVMQMAPTDAAL